MAHNGFGLYARWRWVVLQLGTEPENVVGDYPVFYRVDGGTGEYPVEQGGYVVPCIDLPDRLCFDISEFLRVTLVLPDTGLFTHLLRVGMAGLGQVISFGNGLGTSRCLQYSFFEPLTVVFVLDDL